MRTVSYEGFKSHTHDFQSLASTPNDETCTQAGGDIDIQKIECQALINQLIRAHGQPPAGCEFCLVRNPHDFGTYYEAGIIYPQFDDWTLEQELEDGLIKQEEADTQIAAHEKVWEYINKCEAVPDLWDDEAKQELHEAKHPLFHAKIVQLKVA